MASEGYNPVDTRKPPPAGYVCRKCSVPGHWHTDCPNPIIVKKSSGIPRSFLQPCDPSTPGAKITRAGLFMVDRNVQQALAYAETKNGDASVMPAQEKQQQQPTPYNFATQPPPLLPKPKRRVNYMAAPNKTFVHARFILEVGSKLNAKTMTVATALAVFHKFCRATADLSLYDPYLMAAACLYLSGKIEDNDHLRLRDIINVVWTTLHPDEEPLPLDSEYYNTREAIVQAELHILRMVGFKVRHDHPHRYLLHYLKSLRDWIKEDTWDKCPVAKTAWALLQDSYHDPNLVLDSDPSELSLACIQLALQTYGVKVELTNEASWFKIFNSNTSKDKIWDVMTRIIDTYNQDASFITPHSQEVSLQ